MISGWRPVASCRTWKSAWSKATTCALVDLFDPLHARKVLAAFGRAYGRLPEDAVELSQEQEMFLDRAVEGLAQDGKIICVRLALFADMLKGKPWTTATLSQVGGTEGLGVTFLEETFSASTAPAAHRYHQQAAQAVLKALLPEAGSDIKGSRQSYEALLEASGYAQRPDEFRRSDPDSRQRDPPDHAHGSGGRGCGRSRAGLAHRAPLQLLAAPARSSRRSTTSSRTTIWSRPSATGSPANRRRHGGPGGAAIGRAIGAVERQAREPATALALSSTSTSAR